MHPGSMANDLVHADARRTNMVAEAEHTRLIRLAEHANRSSGPASMRCRLIGVALAVFGQRPRQPRADLAAGQQTLMVEHLSTSPPAPTRRNL